MALAEIFPPSRGIKEGWYRQDFPGRVDYDGDVEGDEKRNFKARGGVIIGIDDKIVSAAKGSKRYIVLPFGSMKTYFVEERYLKIKPKVKKVKK